MIKKIIDLHKNTGNGIGEVFVSSKIYNEIDALSDRGFKSVMIEDSQDIVIYRVSEKPKLDDAEYCVVFVADNTGILSI